MLFSITTVIAAATAVSAHGVITKPIPRAAGSATTAACGKAIVTNIQGDITSHVEGLPELAAINADYHASECNLWLCRGIQYADNIANVQNYTLGQKVNIAVNLRIPHLGTANVSIVDTKKNVVLGSELYYWPHYADEALKVQPANQTNFNIVIPSDLGGACTVAGDCVSQYNLLLSLEALWTDTDDRNRLCNGGGMELRPSRPTRVALTSQFQQRSRYP